MLVLALDTTTRKGSCAVVRDGQVLREDAGDPERGHATRLPADLMMLLARTTLRLQDVDAFAVATGPGSFTGLRIGIATMQGLSFACRRPLIGVSALDALADIAGAGRVITWMDAWRGEVYSCAYENGTATGAPVVQHPEDIVRHERGPATFIGDGAETYRELIERELAGRARVFPVACPLLAATIARIAERRALNGEQPPPHTIRPIYVRRPDVELAREGRRA